MTEIGEYKTWEDLKKLQDENQKIINRIVEKAAEELGIAPPPTRWPEGAEL